MEGLMRSEIKALIDESKKIRGERGDDFFTNSRLPNDLNNDKASGILSSDNQECKNENFGDLRKKHLQLGHMILQYDQKIFDKNNQVMAQKKSRSKSIHLYIDEGIEHFLKSESKKNESKWKLRKNAGLGQLIQKFIEDYKEKSVREDRQAQKIKAIISDFQKYLVEFKESSANPDDYQRTERISLKMSALSHNLKLLQDNLCFDDDSFKKLLGPEAFGWVEFVFKWHLYSKGSL
jgi:hypothetical protein